MKLLIIGGTRFLGRAIVDEGRALGHTLTLFNRGHSNPKLFPDVEQIHGDRNGSLDVLRGRRWDAVIDTCGYVPRTVRASAEFLSGAVDHYTFISTLSVYAEPLPADANENAPVGTLADASIEEITGETYGPLKVLCERAATEAMDGRALLVRSGLIVGPHDPTDRFTYWPVRVARGGEVLAPLAPDYGVQFIDARDIARWALRATEARLTGPYNVTGPRRPLPLGELLDTARALSNSDARFTWVDEAFLSAHEVAPFTEMPLWVPAEAAGFNAFNIDRALLAGLSFRTLEETVGDTLAWAATRPAGYTTRAGLAPDREAALLREWHAANR